MDKEKEIIKKVLTIPLGEWQFVKESGKYSRYETTTNDISVQLWQCMTDSGSPYIIIDGIRFFDKDLISPFYRKLVEKTEKEKQENERSVIDEIFNKLIQ